jgi:hypothetical protein
VRYVSQSIPGNNAAISYVTSSVRACMDDCVENKVLSIESSLQTENLIRMASVSRESGSSGKGEMLLR